MYKLTNNPDMIIRTTDGAYIPRGHRFWDEYEEWLLDPANTVLPADITPISDLRTQAKSEIDQAAEATRSKYLTPGSGQAMSYMKKVEESLKFITAHNNYLVDQALPTPTGVIDPESVLSSNYPWVNSEALAQSVSGTTAANAILSQDAQLNQLGAEIERIRRAGKIDIDTKLVADTINSSKLATITQLQAL